MFIIYRYPSQNNREFDSFLRSVERLLSGINKINSFLSVITGDFNARTLCWWSGDVNTSEELKLLSPTFANGIFQLMNEPTHLQTSNSSCIDLIFTDQPSLSVNSMHRYPKIVNTKLFFLASISIFLIPHRVNV